MDYPTIRHKLFHFFSHNMEAVILTIKTHPIVIAMLGVLPTLSWWKEVLPGMLSFWSLTAGAAVVTFTAVIKGIEMVRTIKGKRK